MTKETGGPAFPCQDLQAAGSREGMTLLDYFAGMALQGILSSQNEYMGHFGTDYERAAQSAYGLADAMLKARASCQNQ